MADDGDAGAAAGPVVLRTNRASKSRRNTQHAKEIAGDEEPFDVANFSLWCEVEPGVGKGEET